MSENIPSERDLRYSICSVTYRGWDFRTACAHAASAGYGGIEITPCVLADDPCAIPAEDRRAYARAIADEGMTFVGFHWILMAPAGLHATTADDQVRRRTWDHVRGLIDLSTDFGSGGVLVFGSPAQRRTVDGASPAEATAQLVEGLADLASHAEAQGVTILLEPLPPPQCDVVTTLAEAVCIVDRIGSPSIRTMFDVHNAIHEAEPHAALIDRYFDRIGHIHVNELDGRHCGAADYDYAPVLHTLLNRGYRRWVSLEPFDLTPGAERVAEESLRTLRAAAVRS